MLVTKLVLKLSISFRTHLYHGPSLGTTPMHYLALIEPVPFYFRIGWFQHHPCTVIRHDVLAISKPAHNT